MTQEARTSGQVREAVCPERERPPGPPGDSWVRGAPGSDHLGVCTRGAHPPSPRAQVSGHPGALHEAPTSEASEDPGQIWLLSGG